jgi:phosphatidylethanolamine-binding protein (PEBP) family uncharacterized protein
MRQSGIGCIILLAGLAALTPEAAMAADLTLDYKFTQRCSKVSPEIRVGNVPPGTVTFSAKLRDLDVPTWRHGGGKVPADPSGVIPQGALKEGYNGPCPPTGSHVYEFTVKALDANGDVLAQGHKKQSFP